jgi:hypothetical protein
MLAHFFLSKKFKWAALTFSAIQTLNSLVTESEIIRATVKSIDDLDG